MYIVAITGASGSILGIRIIEELLHRVLPVTCIVTHMGWQTLNHELFPGGPAAGSVAEVLQKRGAAVDLSGLAEYRYDDLGAPPASGSNRFRAVIAAPLSMKSMAAMAHGYADTLITRIVDVALKEERKTILVPRETPLNTIHLENMLALKRAGASIVIPASSFYTHPETVDDIINFFVGKIFNLLDIEHTLFKPWNS